MATTFTFVTHNGPHPEHRRLVKSHVMRESQKRRKEAKQHQNRQIPVSSQSGQAIKTQFIDSAPRKQNYTLVSSDLQSSRETREDKNIGDVDTSSSSGWGSAAVNSGTGLPCYTYTPKHNLDTFQSFYTRTKESESQKYQQKWLSQCLEDIYARSFSRGQTFESQFLGLNYNETTSFQDYGIRISPNNWAKSLCSSCDEYLEDPSGVLTNVSERLNAAYSYYASKFCKSHSNLEFEDPHKFWESRYALANSKTIIGSVLLYCAYRAAARDPEIYEYDCDYFTSHILYIINRCVEHMDSEISEEEIAIVISVCMYENARGNPSVVTHLRGLPHLIRIHDSDREDDRYLDTLFCLQDFVYAICSNAPPINFEVTGPALRAVQLNQCSLEDEYPQSPLRLLNSGQYEGAVLELPCCTNILKDAFDVFEIMCIEAFDADTAADAAYFFQVRQEQAWGRLQTTMEAGKVNKNDCTEGKMAEAILLAALIHFRAVAFRIQHSDNVNTEDMKRLYAATRAVSNDRWGEVGYVYLWILLTCGAASAHEPAYRPYLVEEILRIGICKGIFGWESFRETVGNFLWLQQYLRGDCHSPSSF